MAKKAKKTKSAKAKPAKTSVSMSAVYKITEIVGTSHTSFAEAAANGIKAASKRLRDLRVAEVEKLDVKIENGKLIYRARLMVSFKYHGDD